MAVKSMYLPLLPGAESEQRITESHRKALLAHYVKGWDIELAACVYDIEPANLSRNIKKVEYLHRQIHDFNIT